MISKNQRAEICHMYNVDHLSIGAITKCTGHHHVTIKRALGELPDKAVHDLVRLKRPGILQEYRQFIEDKLRLYPDLRCTRLLQILRQKGVNVSIHKLRRFIATLRVKKGLRKAFLKVHLYPGEQAQVDWASFGTFEQQGARRKLSLFVMVLSYSRAVFARFYFDQSIESLLSAHIHAFRYFQGVVATILYDNMKTAVIDRIGSSIRFNDQLLDLAAKYSFKPDACNPYAGWEKGRVEKSIRYIRENFYPDRHFLNLDDANEQLLSWLNEHANKRSWVQDRSKTVWDVWQEEQKTLVPFKDDGHIIYRHCSSSVRKTPYVRFDLNDYSVPHLYVNKTVQILACENQVRILHDGEQIAEHKRSYGKGRDIENIEHIKALLKNRGAAILGGRKHFVYTAMAAAQDFLKRLVERGFHLPTAFKKIYNLSLFYEADDIDHAMVYLMSQGSESTDALEHLLQQKYNLKTPAQFVSIQLPDNPKLKDLHVAPHKLSTYDGLSQSLHRSSEGVREL